MTLQDYLRVLRRGWWVIVSLTVLGALAGLAFPSTGRAQVIEELL